ncbi:uncharacterized protein LOC141601378 [Silene latifolia]|uniref:uncharacterized protein LOC141601378 n=1 Tax=Silene latifolia TaxID=37657 RepID=UPI003D77D36B
MLEPTCLIRIMELLCPCGNGPLKWRSQDCLELGTWQKGIPDCLFYSFKDELKQCPCGRGFCCNDFRGREKFWRCCNRGDSCGFYEKIVRIWQPPTWLSQSHSAQSQSSQSPSSHSLEVTPSHTHAALKVSSSGGASSSYAPESSIS